jgi:hypothetical protein
MKRLAIMLMLAFTVVPIAGCVVAPAYQPRPYAAGVWVPGHYNAYGVWIRGHYA